MDTAEAAFAATCEGSGVINAVAFGAIEALLKPRYLVLSPCSNEAANRYLVLRFLTCGVILVFPLMQSAFLNLLDDLLFAHRFGPFRTALLEV